MTDVAIRVEGIGKLYRVGERETALRDVLAGAFRSRRNGRSRPKDSIWAVRDVSFEVRQGEVVGLIGRNGAGKSTLLKLLARITRPTVGGAQLHGRIGSLLEVGTGFHPDLTGRENIFLSGAILGMKKAEIRRKFDEIVAFAEVERFLDSPLKHYSSGMQMRLAFAVAAHLEPEILLVDEVLAVGDVQFQKKCLGKMQDVSRTGRTIIFVSHNVAAVGHLCSRCLVLSGGQIEYDGDTRTAISEHYMPVNSDRVEATYVAPSGRTGPHLAYASVGTSDPCGEHDHGKPIAFDFYIAVPTPCKGLCFSFQLVNEDSVPVCHFWLYDSDSAFGATAGLHRLRCEVPRPRLFMGTYSLTTWLADRRSNAPLESLQNVCRFRIGMPTAHREQYDWRRGECVYLEDAKWEVKLNDLEPWRHPQPA
jgi:lipopolysaccharide transport system ATP-binding protein